jgi:hypothetical protein
MTADECPEVERALWGLYYSIYYCPDAAGLFSNLPRSVIDAFARVQAVDVAARHTEHLDEQFEEINAMAPYESG